MGLRHRVGKLWDRIDRAPKDSELAKRKRAVDGRAMVMMRFLEALPPERYEAVGSLVVDQTAWICDPSAEADPNRPAVVRLVRALAEGRHPFPDPLPVGWLDLYLDHPEAADVARCDCERCGLACPSESNYTRADGKYWQTWPLAPDWRCLLCDGRVQLNAYHLRHGRHPLDRPLTELMLANGGQLTFLADPEGGGERLPVLTRPDPDPCALFAQGIPA